MNPERREMRRTTAWTYRCPAGHQVVVTVHADAPEPTSHRDLFAAEHAACQPVAGETRRERQRRLRDDARGLAVAP